MDNAESLANVVFNRTAKGVAACKASSNELSRHLKSLLLVVDGHSPVAKFVTYLTNLLPLSEKFKELELAGYIQRNYSETSPKRGKLDAPSIRSHLLVNQVGEAGKVHPVITTVLHEIENFLVINAGVEALEIISVLSNIKTIEHLHEELPAYFEFIESYELDTGNHALKLENLLTRY
jgi:hypothetical protein